VSDKFVLLLLSQSNIINDSTSEIELQNKQSAALASLHPPCFN